MLSEKMMEFGFRYLTVRSENPRDEISRNLWKHVRPLFIPHFGVGFQKIHFYC